MRKNLFTLLTACAVMITVALSGCGGGAKSDGISSSNSGLSGVAAIGAPIQGATITLRDSSVPTQVRTTTTSANGSYHFNTQGLTPPFVLTTPWANATSLNQLHAFAGGDGTTNSNPFSHTVYGASGGSDTIAQNPDPTTLNSIGSRHDSVKETLWIKLAQLFALYGTFQDPETGDYVANNTGVDALFDDVNITISNGVITVTNKATGGVIFTASVNNINGGTFNPGNMPGQPGQVDGAALYTSNCSSCHGPLATSTKLGRTASQIQAAIASNTGGMRQFSTLTALQIQAIATALGATGTTPPPTTTPPPATDGATLYTNDCSSCHGPLATSTKLGRTASQIQAAITSNTGGMGQFSTLTAAQIQAIAAALVTTVTPPPPTTTDGATLYTSDCSSCHGPLATSAKLGRTAAQIQAAISSNTGGMGQFSTLTAAQIQAIATALVTTGTTPPPAPVCGSCHAIPPATGHHAYHVSSVGLSCSNCHGTGYSKTTVNAATHDNGTIDLVSSLNYNSAAGTCSPGCHGTHTW